MKIRVLTNRYDYQGLCMGSEHKASSIVGTEGWGLCVGFKHNGKDWSLQSGDYVILKDEEIKEEYTGKSVDYYKVNVDNPTTESNSPYLAECNDIIEALGMNYAEGNAFKAIWRKCAARKFGAKKKGYDNGLYDSEKVVFFGERMVEQSKGGIK